MTAQRDSLAAAILDLAEREERQQLYALAKALNEASLMCNQIAESPTPAAEARSSLAPSRALVLVA